MFEGYKLLLASKSPRRLQLVGQLGIATEVVTISANEDIDPTVPCSDISEMLAKRKSDAYTQTLANNEILLTADTLVVLDDKVLGKPSSRENAIEMLSDLSGKRHQVYTGVCLRIANSVKTFTEATDVYFKKLSSKEIEYYLDNCQYMDKAGAYGIQDWIGMVGVDKIDGDFYNVMGLPVARIYEEICNMIYR